MFDFLSVYFQYVKFKWFIFWTSKQLENWLGIVGMQARPQHIFTSLLGMLHRLIADMERKYGPHRVFANTAI